MEYLLRETRQHNNIIFEDCKLTDSSLGFGGSQYDNIYFDRTNFTNAVFIRPEFNNAHFLNCKLNNLDFNGSSFENCNFVGKLNDCWFRGGFAFSTDIEKYGTPKKNKMFGVSFSKASFSYVEFSENCDLSNVEIPEGKKYKKYNHWFKRLE